MSEPADLFGVSALAGAIRQGRFLSYGGPLSLTVSSDFLGGLYDTLAQGEDGPLEALNQIGFAWGRSWLARIDDQARAYHASVQDISTDDLQQLLQDDLSRSGWGRSAFDLVSHAERGLIVITVTAGPVSALTGPAAEGIAMLQAGFFAGVFAAVTDVDMAGLGIRHEEGGLAMARIVVAHEARVACIWERLVEGDSWAHALAGAS